GMPYEEHEATLTTDDLVLLHSDGLAEAHGAGREMFGLPRVARLVGRGAGGGEAVIDLLLSELGGFTGPGWEQEDDITHRGDQRGGGDRRPERGSQCQQHSPGTAVQGAHRRHAEAAGPRPTLPRHRGWAQTR